MAFLDFGLVGDWQLMFILSSDIPCEKMHDIGGNV